MSFSGLDFDFDKRWCDPAKTLFADGTHALRQAGFFAVDEAPSAQHFSPMRCGVRRRAQDQELLLSRTVSLPGVRSAYLPREPAGYRGLPASPERQALSHGDPQPDFAQHAGGCERSTRLAHLRQLRAALDHDGSQALCRRSVWSRSQRDGLRPRRDDHRFVPVGLPLGSVSHDESRCQTAYPARSAGQYPRFYPYQRRQDARGQHPRSVAAGGWRVLCDGPRISRFREALPIARRGQLFRDAWQVQPEGSTSLLASGGSEAPGSSAISRYS